MRKNLLFAGLVFAVSASFLGVEEADAFCVYNQADQVMYVAQSGFTSSFEVNIDPGGRDCCNWGNKSWRKIAVGGPCA